MNTEKQVVVVVINWNQIQDTLLCLRSVMASDYPNFKVIAIDNHSDVDPREAIVGEFPEVQYIRNTKNLGYTGANNQGISIALELGAEYVWLLNNDTTVHPDAVSHLVNCMDRDPSVGMLSPVLIDSSEYNGNYYGGFMNFEVLKDFPARTPAEYVELFDQNPQDSVLIGAALFIRAAAIKQVGLLDEQFFAYHEDFDLSLRMTRAGWQNTLCFEAVVEHLNIKIDRSPHYYYYMARNGLRFIQKHAANNNRRKLSRKWLAYNLEKAGNYLAKDEKQNTDAILDGVWNALKRHPGAYDERRLMPTGLKTILLWHPLFLARLISS